VTAGGVALQNLPAEAQHGGDRREPAVAPSGIADRATPRENRFGLPQRGPLTGEAWQDAGETRAIG